MELDWSKAPKWAGWWALDKCGNAIWYEEKPEPRKCGSWSTNKNGRTSLDLNACPHWGETLQKRPKKLEIKAGGIYRTRGGKKAWVLMHKEGGLPFKGAVTMTSIDSGSGLSGCCWREDGACYATPRRFDLVSEWEEQA